PEEKKDINLKYIILLKVFEVLNEMLDIEQANGQAVTIFDSYILRVNIGMVLASLNEFKDSLTDYQQEIHQLVSHLVPKLYTNEPAIVEIINHRNDTSYSLNCVMGRIIQNT